MVKLVEECITPSFFFNHISCFIFVKYTLHEVIHICDIHITLNITVGLKVNWFIKMMEARFSHHSEKFWREAQNYFWVQKTKKVQGVSLIKFVKFFQAHKLTGSFKIFFSLIDVMIIFLL